MIPRRRFLQAAAASTAALALPAAPALAATRPAEGTLTDLGPASVASPLGNGEFVGDVLYMGSRGLSPNVVGAWDLVQDRITAHFDIPTGVGVWAMCKHGTDVYVGTHSRSDLYKIDTLNGTTTKLAEYPDHFIWTMAAAPDGKVYMGMSEPGRVVEYDPATGTSRDLGQPAPGEAYVRSIQADDRHVYAGVGANAHLIAIDRRTGEKRELLPAELADRDWVSSMAGSDTHLAGGLNSTAELVVIEKANPANYKIVKASVPGEKYTVAVLIFDGWVYFAGRPSGTVYRYELASGRSEVLGVPFPEAQTVRILEHKGKVYGLQDSGVFVYDPATGAMDYLSHVQRGFRSAAEAPMSVHSDGRTVYVGGKSGADLHDLATGKVTRLPIPGEPKTMITVRGTTYLGVYTQGALYAHKAGQPEAKLLLRTGHNQDRPKDLAYDHVTGLIAMPTQPEPGHQNGALNVYDPRSGKLDTYRPVVDRQTIFSVTAYLGTLYCGTSTQEGLGSPPVTPTAKLAAFDLRTRKVRWEIEPLPGVAAITDLAHTPLAVYGITNTGVLFEYHLLRRKVTRTLKVSARGGDLYVAGLTAYTADADAVYRVDLRAWTVRKIVSGLAGDWFGGTPKLGIAPDRRALYTIKGRNLVSVAIRP
ncbi:PQQ-binding-like beta-propeller repeat protein [Nonomuraea sp. NPDC050790]|uniref:outer membrane protein assembly factor BamB family protein n=1 Tax=Nonomuraea sp. NPDC050790 TaxID=3364371 RepID=UPI00379C128C